MKIFTKMESRFFPHIKWRFASLLLSIFILFSGCSGFEEILPTQPAPIGLVRDHSNDCIYVIFLHEINMVCNHITPKVTNVVSERELQGNPLTGWLDRVDADGYFVFCVGYFKDNYASCIMHATRLARDNSQKNTTRYISAPDLLSRFSDGRLNTKNSFHLSAIDNKTIYMMATRTSNSSAHGLFAVSISNTASSIQNASLIYQVPVFDSPSFAFVAPDALGFRTMDSSGIFSLFYLKMISLQVVAVNNLFGLAGSDVAYLLTGPIVACARNPTRQFSWVVIQPATTFTFAIHVRLDLDTGNTGIVGQVSIALTAVIVDAVGYNCTVGAVSYDDSGAAILSGIMDFNVGAKSFGTIQSLSSVDMSALQGGDDTTPPVFIASKSGRSEFINAMGIVTSPPEPSVVSIAGKYLFSFRREGTGYPELRVYTLEGILASIVMNDPSTNPRCSISIGMSSSMAALAFNSTYFAIALQRPAGTFLEFHHVGNEFGLSSSIAGEPIPLFPSRSTNVPPFSFTGSSVVQNIDNHQLLVTASSILASGSPVVVSMSTDQSTSHTVLSNFESADACPALAVSRTAIFDITETRGLLLYNNQSSLSNFAVLDLQQNTTSKPIRGSENQELQLMSPNTVRIVPGTLPAFISANSVALLSTTGPAGGGPAAWGFTGTNATQFIANVSLPTDWAFATSMTQDRTIVFLCGLRQICALDMDSSSISNTSQLAYSVANQVTLLALPSGNFVAFEIGSNNTYIYVNGASWAQRSVSGSILAGLALPDNDQFILLLRDATNALSFIKTVAEFDLTLPYPVFYCTGCSSFNIRSISLIPQMALVTYRVGVDAYVGYVDLQATQMKVTFIRYFESQHVLSVVHYDGDSYLVQVANNLTIFRLGSQVSVYDIAPDPMLSSVSLGAVSVVKISPGRFRPASTITERSSPDSAPRAIFMEPFLCRSTGNCSAGTVCDGFVCKLRGAAAACPVPAPFGALCVAGVYVINNDTTSGGSVVIVTPVVINGSLTLTNSSAITIQSNASITVSGCLTVGGDLVVNLPVESSQASGNITVIEFGGGYCGGVPGTFKSATVVVEGAPACSKVQNNVGYGERSISLLYQYDISGCAPNDASVAALSVGAMVGIAVGGAVLVAIILATVFYVRFRQKVLPYDARRRSKVTAHEME